MVPPDCNAAQGNSVMVRNICDDGKCAELRGKYTGRTLFVFLFK